MLNDTSVKGPKTSTYTFIIKVLPVKDCTMEAYPKIWESTTGDMIFNIVEVHPETMITLVGGFSNGLGIVNLA